ncbi:unnamed protein product [Closterium sp. Naga37s-1]|nr:unnamed protein product [Closterium sp. Naga37s-1]
MAGPRSSQRSTVSSRSTTPHAASSGTISGANFGGSSAPASPSFLSRAFPALAASVLALTAVVFAFTYSRPSLGRCDLLQLQLLGRKQGDDLGKHLKVLEKQMNYNKKLVGALQASLAKLTAADSAAAAEADASAPADVAIPGNASTRQLVELAARQVADEVRASMEETCGMQRRSWDGDKARSTLLDTRADQQVAEGGKGGGGGRRRRLAGGVSTFRGRGGGGGMDQSWFRVEGGEVEGGEMEEWEVSQEELESGGEEESVREKVEEVERRAGGRRRLLMSRDEWPRVTYLFRGKMAHQRHPEENATEERDLNNKFLESFKQPGGQQPDLQPLFTYSPLFTPLHLSSLLLQENATEERDLNNKFLESFKQPGGQQPDFLIMSIGAHEVIGWNRRLPPDLDVATFKRDTEELLQLQQLLQLVVTPYVLPLTCSSLTTGDRVWNRRPPPDLDVATFKRDTEELLQLQQLLQLVVTPYVLPLTCSSLTTGDRVESSPPSRPGCGNVQQGHRGAATAATAAMIYRYHLPAPVPHPHHR